MSKVLFEGNLRFDFNACGIAEKFDIKGKNPNGMKVVDFIAETTDCLYFIEVKDYQHPNAPLEQKIKDFHRLVKAAAGQNTIFNLEMGEKIKDSLLIKFAEGYTFNKRIVYLLVINLDELDEYTRGRLKEKIIGHIPIGLNSHRFNNFTNITFDLVDTKQLVKYGIVCT